jgi:hypothetical protein
MPQLSAVFEGIRIESEKAFLKYSSYLIDWQDFIKCYPEHLDELPLEHRPPFSLPTITERGHLVSSQGMPGPHPAMTDIGIEPIG